MNNRFPAPTSAPPPPPAEMLPEAMRFARILCEAGPLAVQAVKRSVVEGLALPPEQALEREMELGFPVSKSEDCREGT